MPIPDAAAFASSPELLRTLRAGLACSLSLPLEQVQLNSTTDSMGTTVFFDESDNGGSGACESRRRRLGSAASLSAASPHPMRKLQWVSSLAQLGPGRAIWFHDALSELTGARPLVGARRLAVQAGVAIRLVIPADSSTGDSAADVTGKQQDAASQLVASLNQVQSSEALGGSSPLLDSLSTAGFFDAYSSSTGVNPVDLAASLAVSEPEVNVPSSTGTGTPSPSTTGTRTPSPSMTGTGTPSSLSGTPSKSQLPLGAVSSASGSLTRSQTDGIISGVVLGVAALVAGVVFALLLLRKRAAAAASAPTDEPTATATAPKTIESTVSSKLDVTPPARHHYEPTVA